jgi:hypothetical protein
MSDEPRTKPELLALIEERWTVLQALLRRLSDAEMEQPLGDGWSAKVHLGHLAAWERSLMGLLRKENRGDAMGLPREIWDAHDLDGTNGYLARATGVKSLETVRSESDATHAELMALLTSMTQEDLEMPYSHYQPDDKPFNGSPVGGWVHGNTWDHYNEHIGWLEAGLA